MHINAYAYLLQAVTIPVGEGSTRVLPSGGDQNSSETAFVTIARGAVAPENVKVFAKQLHRIYGIVESSFRQNDGIEIAVSCSQKNFVYFRPQTSNILVIHASVVGSAGILQHRITVCNRKGIGIQKILAFGGNPWVPTVHKRTH